MNEFISLLSRLIEPIIILRLCVGFLGFKKEKLTFLKSFLLFLLLISVNFAVKLVLWEEDPSNIICTVVSAGVVLGFAVLLMRGSISQKLLVSIMPFAFFLLYLLFAWMEDVFPYGLGIWVGLILKFLILEVGEYFIRRYKLEKYSLTSLQWIIQLSCLLISFFVLFSLWTVSDENGYSGRVLMFVSALIAVLNVLLYFLMRKMQRDNVIKEEYMLSRMNIAAQEKFVLEARERYFEMRTLRHDMRHYLTAAAELISDGKPDEAKRYIESILDEKINTAVVGIATGSAVIDAVVNNRIALCYQRGIEIKCAVDTSGLGNAEVDVSILLSNLLDNAIEGCGGIAPLIELAIESRKSMLFIAVRNTVAAPVLTENPALMTSKSDSSSHGFGIMSVRKIAEKYKGSAEFRDEDVFFTAEVWLDMPFTH